MTDDQVKDVKLKDWPIGDEYLTELGRISALWGSLETALNVCLGKLAGFNDLSDPTHFILFTHASFPQRLDMLGTLCEHLSAAYPNLKEHPTVIGALRGAQRLRNKYAHNGLTANESTGTIEIATGSARGTLKFSVETVSLTDLKRVSMAIHQAMLDLYKLVLKRDLRPVWERPEDGKGER